MRHISLLVSLGMIWVCCSEDCGHLPNPEHNYRVNQRDFCGYSKKYMCNFKCCKGTHTFLTLSVGGTQQLNFHNINQSTANITSMSLFDSVQCLLTSGVFYVLVVCLIKLGCIYGWFFFLSWYVYCIFTCYVEVLFFFYVYSLLLCLLDIYLFVLI